MQTDLDPTHCPPCSFVWRCTFSPKCLNRICMVGQLKCRGQRLSILLSIKKRRTRKCMSNVINFFRHTCKKQKSILTFSMGFYKPRILWGYQTQWKRCFIMHPNNVSFLTLLLYCKWISCCFQSFEKIAI